MNRTNEHNERRDWTLLIFLIPVGILLIIIVGQFAVRLVPQWDVDANMKSNLNPNSSGAQPFALLEPILPQILTPMAWSNDYLTPNGNVSFPPFVTFEPSATPSPTIVESQTPTEKTPTPSPTVTNTPSPTATTVTGTPPTKKPTDNNDTDTPAPTTTTNTPTTTSTATPTDTPSATPTDAPTSVPYTLVSPTPIEISTQAPSGNAYNLVNGYYLVLNNPVIVAATPDNNYDMVFYESQVGTNILLDYIIIGISNNSDGSGYYEVFNWGNNVPDTNTNVDTNNLPADINCTGPSAPECDNRVIPTSVLYPTPDPNTGTCPSICTGILIDVDNAPSSPPPASYNYVVIISPNSVGGDASQIDAIVVTEVPLPTPTP